MFITGPDVVKSVTQEEVSKEDLGGVGVHMTKSGVAHLSAENDIECINYIRELISYLPGNNMEEPPFVATSDSPTRLTPELSNLVPTNPNQPYDIKEMIEAVADDNSFFELQAEFAATERRWESLLTSRWFWQGLWILMHLSRLPVSSVSATLSIYLC